MNKEVYGVPMDGAEFERLQEEWDREETERLTRSPEASNDSENIPVKTSAVERFYEFLRECNRAEAAEMDAYLRAKYGAKEQSEPESSM